MGLMSQICHRRNTFYNTEIYSNRKNINWSSKKCQSLCIIEGDANNLFNNRVLLQTSKEGKMSWDNGLDIDTAAYKFAAATDHVIRVVAGPGTGKSFSLQRRVARLLEEGVDPKKILAVTFTRTAASDLKKAISDIGIEGSDNVVARTLHSLCFGFLNRNHIIQSTGRHPRPVLEFEINPMMYDVGTNFGDLRTKKKRLSAFEAAWARLQSEEPGFPTEEIDIQFEAQIKRWLHIHKAMLFGEMIVEAYRFLRNNPMCKEIQEFDYILVDEYQDLNKAEQAVIELLADGSQFAIIGDDDQSIYSFKHAHPSGIREFSDKHDGCVKIDFDICRRCPTKVVSMASKLISNNPERTLGDLSPLLSNQEGKVDLIQWKSSECEIIGLTQIIEEEIKQEGIYPQDILVLTPSKKLGIKIRDKLLENNISAKCYYRDSALRNMELEYKFELFTLVANPEDMVALRYLLGYGDATFRNKGYSRICTYAAETDLSTFEVFRKLMTNEIKIPYSQPLLNTFSRITEEVTSLREKIANDRDNLPQFLLENVEESEDMRLVLEAAVKEIDYESEDQWLKEVYQYCVESIGFPDLVSDESHVKIMTLHSSKGLSSKFVVVMSAVDQLIPRVNHDSDISEEKQIEEQRRLFYVAITRCKGSENGYPGKLVISSFVGLPGDEALRLNIQAIAWVWRSTFATRFINEFENTAPQTIVGENLIKQTTY